MPVPWSAICESVTQTIEDWVKKKDMEFAMQSSGTFPGLSDGVKKTIQNPLKAKPMPKAKPGKKCK